MPLHSMKREHHAHISGPSIWQELIFCQTHHPCLLSMKLQMVKQLKVMLLYLVFHCIASRTGFRQLCKEFALGKRLSWLLCESLLCMFGILDPKDKLEINRGEINVVNLNLELWFSHTLLRLFLASFIICSGLYYGCFKEFQSVLHVCDLCAYCLLLEETSFSWAHCLVCQCRKMCFMLKIWNSYWLTGHSLICLRSLNGLL